MGCVHDKIINSLHHGLTAAHSPRIIKFLILDYFAWISDDLMANTWENLVRIILLQASFLDRRIKEAIEIETRCSSLNQAEAGLGQPNIHVPLILSPDHPKIMWLLCNHTLWIDESWAIQSKYFGTNFLSFQSNIFHWTWQLMRYMWSFLF